MVDLWAQEQKATEELQKMKEDRDATVAKLEEEIAELKAKEVLAKKSSIKEYKSSDDFQEEVVLAASKYFGEGFNLCNKQIRRLHPKLDIQDMEIDDELAKEEEGEEEGNQDANPLSR